MSTPPPIPSRPGRSELPPGIMQCRMCRLWYNVYEGPHESKCPARLGTMDKVPRWVPPLPAGRRVLPRKVA